ncbi:MAG: M15 family metallopeptidase, partial [Bacteroidia bacterium]
MHYYRRRFLLIGFAFFMFVACDNSSESTSHGPEGAAEAERWNAQKQDKGVPLAILDTSDAEPEEATEASQGEYDRAVVEEKTDSLEQVLIDAGLVNVATLDPSILVELKYASKDNFLKRNVYGVLNKCYLQPEAAAKLVKASELLQEGYPDLRLLVYDAVRPRSVQFAMWRIVKGTPQQSYVASPKSGSVHNYGAAVDLTLATADGTPLDMG